MKAPQMRWLRSRFYMRKLPRGSQYGILEF